MKFFLRGGNARTWGQLRKKTYSDETKEKIKIKNDVPIFFANLFQEDVNLSRFFFLF